ncbi:hypothetical protein F2P81_025572 [Scophthalmus maximus]|uniref:Uncharacterized protein n=1 Tax=Scophthalmus maximus TaxID=52904 RepID=A0A6A4RPL8_SCOMX|nr:hypothetical protein F2P81_025572 [Scophthalmus maximus]
MYKKGRVKSFRSGDEASAAAAAGGDAGVRGVTTATGCDEKSLSFQWPLSDEKLRIVARGREIVRVPRVFAAAGESHVGSVPTPPADILAGKWNNCARQLPDGRTDVWMIIRADAFQIVSCERRSQWKCRKLQDRTFAFVFPHVASFRNEMSIFHTNNEQEIFIYSSSLTE